MKTKTFSQFKQKSEKLLHLFLMKQAVKLNSNGKTRTLRFAQKSLIQNLVQLKKALNFISQYETLNKKIWYVGMPTKFSNKKIPQSLYLKQLKKSLTKSKTSTKSSVFSLDSVGTSPDLIVLLNESRNSEELVKHAGALRIPIILFTNRLSLKGPSIIYNIFGDTPGKKEELMSFDITPFIND